MASFALAQETMVKGIVLDANNKESLAFASVIFKGTTIGTTTDIDGKF